MTAKAFMARLAAIGVLVATVSTGLLTGTASAAIVTERACNSYYCNNTVGSFAWVLRVDAARRSPLSGKYGFFEVFGPNGYKQTGPSGFGGSHRFIIDKFFNNNSLICLRFFERVGQGWTERGSAACTRTPIG